MKFSLIMAVMAVLAAGLSSCSEPKFGVSGEVTGGEGKTLVLEKSDFEGRWVAVDSTRIGGNGKFSIKSDAPASPEIYRLSLGDSFIYLPIDSVENLSVTTTSAEFGRKFSLTGTQQAELLAAFEKELMGIGTPDSTAMASFKRNVYTRYIKDGRGSILSYYVLTKFYDGKPLFDPADPADLKYYSAVATQFANYRPGDPHGKMVEGVALEGMRRQNSARGNKRVVEAEELRVIDVELPDVTGKNVRLSDLTGKGRPVVVVFSMMNTPDSPAFNRELARIYDAHRGSLEIYQISFDTGRYEWREAASNLPWTNVIDPDGTASTALLDYNVGSLPAVFLYNASGDLVDRPESLSALEAKLR